VLHCSKFLDSKDLARGIDDGMLDLGREKKKK
jgi:hypothetical protein